MADDRHTTSEIIIMSAIEIFSKDVHEGLKSSQKHLPSKYFYDTKGDMLFQQIMDMPEYYLTRAEHEIFSKKVSALIRNMGVCVDSHFELIELGAGDGTKTKELLQELSQKKYSFDYLPVDISSNALNMLEKNIKRSLPYISLKKQCGDYFHMLSSLKSDQHKKVVLFLGSNIGNMSDQEAKNFLRTLSDTLNPGDTLILGVDLIKDKNIILPAYNDKKGITKSFNLNLLNRINSQLGGNFNIANFEHTPEYLEDEGIAKSYLTSKIDQTIHIEKTGHNYTFSKGEKIYTEMSRKYNDNIVKKITAHSGFTITHKISDYNEYFSDYIFIKQ